MNVHNKPNAPVLDSYWMPFTANRQFKAAPRLLAAAEGMYYTSADGRQVLDGTAGLWCVNAGHGRRQIAAAVERQLTEMDFAPSTSVHGSMVDIQGIGVLIRGKSGVGKSEAVLGLIERGYSLVADDVTRFTCIEGRDLRGTSSDLTRHHMEVRGLGIINVGAMFGVGSIRLAKRLDLVATLKDWAEMGDIDRTGLEGAHYEILGIRIPHVIVPVRPGRDVARLIEVAALDAKLKAMGHHSAADFNERLKAAMSSKLQ